MVAGGARLNGCPVYDSACGTMRLCRAGECMWRITRGCRAVAYATTRALHPATVFETEWHVLEPRRARLAFAVAGAAEATPRAPVPMEALGLDYFVRCLPRRPVWFRAPDGTVVHSGAKPCPGSGAPGRRYCHLCDALLSANNFVSQHLAQQHEGEGDALPVECDFANYVSPF